MWTITYNGVEKAAADWGLNAQPVIRTRDRSPTTVSFRLAGADPAAALPFPFRAQVIIRQNRTLTGGAWGGAGYVFTGYLTTQKSAVSGRGQGAAVEFADAIWLLQNTTFQQIWRVGNNATVPASRVVLFQDYTQPWLLQPVAWQIQQIIAYAASCGIALQPGTIDYTGWEINFYQVRAISCWDALLKCLEPIPDAKVWVDGSTSPATLHVRTRANLAALPSPTATGPGPLTLPWRGVDARGRRHFSSDLTPRPDLVPPQVVIQYQVNNTLDGQPVNSFINDVWPAASTGQMPFAMVVPIDLTGLSFTTSTGQMDAEPLACVGGTHAEKRAWWASKRGGEQSKLADGRVRFQDAHGNFVAIGDATVTDDAGQPIDLSQWPCRHVAGTHHEWMKSGQTPIGTIRAHVRVAVTLAEYDVPSANGLEQDTNGNVTRKSAQHELHTHIRLTNAPPGVTFYKTLSASGPGETPAVGLAQNIFNSRAMLDYDGAHEIIDPGNAANLPLAQIIGHWNVLNFTGGDPAWANANLTIAGSEIDLQTNHQRLELGPSKHLSPQDWNEMLQFFRGRRTLMPPAARANQPGDVSGNVVDMAKGTPDGNTVEGLKVDTYTALVAPDPVDVTRQNVFQSDAVTGQMTFVQQNLADGAPRTKGVLPPLYNGLGAPSGATLKPGTAYRQYDLYADMTAPTSPKLYLCVTAGTETTSVWSLISGGGVDCYGAMTNG